MVVEGRSEAGLIAVGDATATVVVLPRRMDVAVAAGSAVLADIPMACEAARVF